MSTSTSPLLHTDGQTISDTLAAILKLTGIKPGDRNIWTARAAMQVKWFRGIHQATDDFDQYSGCATSQEFAPLLALLDELGMRRAVTTSQKHENVLLLGGPYLEMQRQFQFVAEQIPASERGSCALWLIGNNCVLSDHECGCIDLNLPYFPQDQILEVPSTQYEALKYLTHLFKPSNFMRTYGITLHDCEAQCSGERQAFKKFKLHSRGTKTVVSSQPFLQVDSCIAAMEMGEAITVIGAEAGETMSMSQYLRALFQWIQAIATQTKPI